MPEAISDIDLLRLEIETLWVTDARGRLLHVNEPGARPPPLLVFAISGGERALAFGAQVSDDLSVELTNALSAQATVVPGEPPAGLERCRRLLEAAFGPVQAGSGPTYVVPPGLTFGSEARTYSSRDDVAALRDARPKGAWTAGEWRELLDGASGPFAIATVDNQVVSICHTSRTGKAAVEAGVWTRPDFRRQGHACAVTAAWAALFDDEVTRFYSTSAENVASQGVAAKLGLREIGHCWSLRFGQ